MGGGEYEWGRDVEEEVVDGGGGGVGEGKGWGWMRRMGG